MSALSAQYQSNPSSPGELSVVQTDQAQLSSTSATGPSLQDANQRAGWDIDWSKVSFTYTGSILTSPNAVLAHVVGDFQGRTKAKLSSATANGTTVSVVNDKSAWIASGSSKYAVSYDGLYDSIAVFPFLADLSAISDPSVSVSYDGIESVGGTQTYKFTIHHASTPDPAQRRHIDARPYDTRVWLAVETMLPIRVESRRSTTTNAFEAVLVRREYADYRSMNGIMVPFTIREFMGSNLISTLSISSIQFGVTLSATDFQATN